MVMVIEAPPGENQLVTGQPSQLVRRFLCTQPIPMLKVLVTCTTVALLLTGPVFAQTKAPTRTEASMECSRQADEKGLHGKARKHLRSKCVRAAKKHG